MGNMFDDVKVFQQKFGVPIYPQVDLRRLTPEQYEFLWYRLSHICEEFEELVDAVRKKETVEFFDALIDLIYVALGIAANCSFPFEEGWDIVHRANMRKVPVSRTDQNGRHQFDVVKPPDWNSPINELRDLLQKGEYHDDDEDRNDG